MAYVTVTNGAAGQILGYDSNNASNITINMQPDNIKTSVTALKAALAVAEKMATVFGVDLTDKPTASSGTTTSGTTSGSSMVTSGGTAT